MASKFAISAKGHKFVPLLFAGDIGVYSMARAFYEAYGTLSYAYGKYPTGACMHSAILSYSAVPTCDQPEEFLRLVYRFAQDHSDKTVLLIGCGDNYVELISAAKDHLPDNVIAPAVGPELLKKLTNKESFYALCDETGIDYPLTFVYHRGDSLDFALPFDAPYILKPANGPDYWLHPYKGQKKVYKLKNAKEVKDTIIEIYGAGYTDSLIIQEFIPGDDSFMRVLTSYSDGEGRVRMMCLGHVFLEEHTPHGIGNHAVIITEYDEALMLRYKDFLEKVGYTGFSNFDIKYDERDGRFKAFELNARQGRSNYYVTAAGANLAELLVKDRIDGEELPFQLVNNEFLWTVLPLRLVFKYIDDKKALIRIKGLCMEGKVENPMFCGDDRNSKRNMFIVKNQYGQFYKYWKYFKRGK